MGYKTFLYGAVSLASVIASIPAMAQNADDTAASAGNEIIVTATKREQSLKDVPVAVDVATGEDLERFNLFDFKDVAALAPGLQLTSDGRNTTATLRGISFDPDIGGPAAIGVYFNEVPVDINVISTGLYDVQQVEVLRGPQGTLRGRTAPAGAITITTRRADLDRPTSRAQMTFSERGTRNLQAAASVPIIPGVLGLRVAGLIDRNLGNQTFNINRQERSKQRTNSARGTLSFKSGDFSANLIYQYTDSYLRQSAQVFGPGAQPSLFSPERSGPAISLSDRYSATSGETFYTNRTHLAVADFRWDMDNYTISGLAGYQDTNLFSQMDRDVTNAVPSFAQFLIVPNPSKTYTGELRVDSKYDGMFNFTAGMFYNRSRTFSPSTYDTDTLFGNASPYTPFPATMFRLPITALTDITNNNQDMAIFGEARFEVTEKLRVEVGARLTQNKAYTQNIVTVVSPGGIGFPQPGFTIVRGPSIAPDAARQKALPLTGTASVSYEWSPEVTTYVTYGRSFRRGAPMLAAADVDPSLLTLDPERSDAVEIGLKSQLFNRRVSLNIAAFYQKFDGFIGLTGATTASARDGVIDSAGFQVSFNGDAVAKGVEMQLASSLTPFWDASLNMSYNDARYKNAIAPCDDFNFDGIPNSDGVPAVPIGQQVSFCKLNTRLNQSPEFQLSATSEARIPVGGAQAFVRGLYNFTPGFVQESSNYRIPAVHNLNLFLGVRGEDASWEVALFARNLLNNRNIISISADQGRFPTRYLQTPPTGAPTTSPEFLSGLREVRTQAPREVGVSASFNF